MSAEMDIRADVCEADAKLFAEQIFGLEVSSCTPLPGYEDKNFRIRGRFKHIASEQGHDHEEFVLKVANALDSTAQNRRVIEAQNELMLFLSQRGFPVQRPLVVTGTPVEAVTTESYYVVKQIAKSTCEHNCAAKPDGQRKAAEVAKRDHLVRLLTFVPGEVMLRVRPVDFSLFFETGRFLRRLHKALRTFDNEALRAARGLWNFEAVSGTLHQFVSVLDSQWKRDIVQSTVARFRESNEHVGKAFRRGWIHGDPNEQNLLIDPATNRVCGLLDFQDTHCSSLAFDVALLICYTMFLDTSNLRYESDVSWFENQAQAEAQGDFVGEALRSETAIVKLLVGGHVVAGYLSESNENAEEEEALSGAEFASLPVLVATRFAQSLTLGEYTYRCVQPPNDYVLSTARNGGWHMLRLMHLTSSEKLLSVWQRTIESYNLPAPNWH